MPDPFDSRSAQNCLSHNHKLGSSINSSASRNSHNTFYSIPRSIADIKNLLSNG